MSAAPDPLIESAEPRPGTVTEMIERARIETLFRFNRSGVILTFFLGPLVAWRLGVASTPEQFWIWGAVLISIAIIRALVGYSFVHYRHVWPDVVWHRAMVLLAFGIGACWGSLVLPIFEMPSDARLLATALLLAVTGIGMISYMASTQAFIALALPVFLSLLYGCLVQQTALGGDASLMVGFFMAIMLFSSLRMRRQFEDNLEARWREAELRREADQANAAKSRFLAAMSHELRTPLNGMLGMAEMLSRAPLAPPLDGYVRAIRHTGKHLTAVVADVLDFARLEAHQIRAVPAPVALRSLIEDTLLPWELEARNKGLVLATDIDAELPEWIETDGLRLAQVLINLVGNAIKFTEHGTIRVAVVRGNDGRLDISVEDTGIGIDDNTLKAMFDPFAQGVRSGRQRQDGTGLGLSISIRLVQLMGGDLDASSRPARGSRFVFHVPLIEAVAPIEPAADGLMPWLEAEVLVAEDNELNREIAQLFLESIGLRVRTAENGRLAIDAWREKRPDLILMDCDMPELDGLTAARTLRSLGAREPIIALTAHALPEDQRACLDAGMDAVLTKPLDLAVLKSTLATILKGRHKRA